ncbi:MAG: aldehyde dehydrogenase [Candidatus Binataceae bacterium]|nr:aldehyde dehydrogenase [Candidatus Binataceae bacterium]
MKFVPHVIDGREVESLDGKRFESINPYTRKPWAEVALGSRMDAERAITAARRAFDEGPWPRMGYQARAKILHKLADLMERQVDELAEADSRDMGKPVTDMKVADVPRSAHNFRFFADFAKLASAESFPSDTGHHMYTRYEPAGVVVAIAPWNFPLMLETWKIAPPLSWGNTVVLKPAEDTPSSASIMAKLALEAGMPPGVLNVVQGFGPESVGQFLTESPQVDRITFTGESGTGRAIARAAAANLIPVSFELGGKGANLVFEDADLNQAVPWSIRAIFSNAGQVCLAGSRLFVQDKIFDAFVDKFVGAAKQMVIGDPMEAKTQVGPLSSETHFKKVSSYFDAIAKDGGEIVTGGIGEGWSVKPTVVLNPPLNSRACREEIFGPVVMVNRFSSEEEGIKLANDTVYGLNAMVFTENLRRAHRAAAALHAGTVWVNCFFIRDLRAPFGGVGDSGVGREGGSYSREFCTEPKAIVMEI